MCVFGFKKSSDVFLSSIYSHLAGKTLEIATVTFEAISQVGLFEKKDKPSYCRSMRKATFQSTGFGCFEVETTPNVKVRKVVVASSIDIDCTSENDQFCGIQTQMF